MTEAAATRDRRVKPVRADEIEQIHIDISVISSLTRSAVPLSLEVGKHGLHVACARKRGVLLPQVAVEYGWDIETFLATNVFESGVAEGCVALAGHDGFELYGFDHRGGKMKRRGFLGVAGAALVLPLRGIADAICNPSLVHLFHQGRQFIQARGNGLKSPSLGSYFVNWYGHSSFLIQSGSQTKIVADPNFNVTPGIQADAVTVSNDHFTHNNTGAVTGNPDHSPRHHLQANLESDPNQR